MLQVGRLPKSVKLWSLPVASSWKEMRQFNPKASVLGIQVALHQNELEAVLGCFRQREHRFYMKLPQNSCDNLFPILCC